MKHIIAVCGAGGKTTFCKTLANHLAKENKMVCVLTTTHMWHDETLSDINRINKLTRGKVYYFGNLDGEKVTFVNDIDYKFICKKFDFIIIEADGSKSMPMKIPNYAKEPVIPKNVTEIIVVSGLQALGRELGVVCHRFNEYSDSDNFIIKKKFRYDTIVTKKILEEFADHYYIEYLGGKYPKARFYTCFTNMSKSANYKRIHKVGIALCASGASKRFGVENKLLAKIDGKELYKVMIEKLLVTKKLVLKKFHKDCHYDDLTIDIALISKYDTILNDKDIINDVIMIKNDNAEVGLSNSVKLAVNEFYDYDAIMFINSDLPNLEVKELSMYLYNSICSNSSISAMYTDMPKNPAYFEKKYFDEILKIEGDKGPKDLLDKYKKILYKYYINKENLVDIDTKEDLKNILERS